MVSYVIIAVLIAFVQRARKPSRNYETKLPDGVSTYEYLLRINCHLSILLMLRIVKFTLRLWSLITN